jgi:hypothetical protein
MSKKGKAKVYAPGTVVRFLGYSEETGEPSLLEEGQEYEIHAVNNADSKEYEMSYYLRVINPDYDSDEEASEDNVAFFLADVFPDEVEFVSAPPAEATVAPAEIVATPKKETGDAQLAALFDAVQKGDTISVTDITNEKYSGVVLRKTKTLISIQMTADKGEEAEVLSFRIKDLTSIVMGTLPVEEKAPVKEKKTKATKTAAVPAKAKKVAAPPPPPVEEEEEEDTDGSDEDEVTAPVVAAKEEAPVKRGRGRPKGSKNKKTLEKEAAEPTVKAGKTTKPAKLKEASPPKEEEDEDLKGMLLLTEDEEDQNILDLIDEAGDICDLAQELTHEAANADYRLGGVLYHVRLSKAYKALNPEYSGINGFGMYAANELGMHYRKAMYLINIYTKWRKYGLDADKVAELGWSKAQIVAQYLNEDNADSLLEIAETTAVTDLRDAIKESVAPKGKDTRETVKRITVKLRFTEEQGAVVQDYLEMAMKALNLPRIEDAVEHIITEWAQEHMEVTKVRKAARVEEEEEEEDEAAVEEVPAKKTNKQAGKPIIHKRTVKPVQQTA